MTTHTERIMEMAREAGLLIYSDELARFAQLVAEDCADIVDNADTPDCGGWSACEIANDIRARYNR